MGCKCGCGSIARAGEAARERPQANEGQQGAVLGARGLRGRRAQTPPPSSPGRPATYSRSELPGTFRHVCVGQSALVRNLMAWELLPPAPHELSSSLEDDKSSNSLQPNKPGRWAAAAFRLLGRRPAAPGSRLLPSARGQLGVRGMLLCFTDSLCRPPVFLPGSHFLGTPSSLTISLCEAASPGAHAPAAEPLPHPQPRSSVKV